MSSGFDSGGKGGSDGGKAGKKGGGLWDGLKSFGSSLLDGIAGGIAVGGGAGRRDPVAARDRPAAARQIHRSMKAWRDKEEEGKEAEGAETEGADAGAEKAEAGGGEPGEAPAAEAGAADAGADAGADDAKAEAGADGGADAEGEAEGGEAKEAEGEAEEAPAAEEAAPEVATKSKSIAAKLKGVHRKVFLAPKPKPAAPPAAPKPAAAPAPAPAAAPPAAAKLPVGTVADSGSATVDASATRTQDPMTFAGSKGKYDAQFATVKAAIESKYTVAEKKEEAGKKFEAKKNDWYKRWGAAVLAETADAANSVFPAIEAEAAALMPDDKPAAGGGNLYSGQAAGARGRSQAEAHAAANPVGGRPGTLETTNMGRLFDGVAGQGKDKPADQWLPWNDTAQAWWSTISATYAKSLRGQITAHVCVGFPYQLKNLGPMTKAQATAKKAEIGALIKLPDNVFSNAELDQVTKLMEENLATLLVNLKLEVSAGVVIDCVVGPLSSGNARQQIDAKIKSVVTVDGLLKNYT